MFANIKNNPKKYISLVFAAIFSWATFTALSMTASARQFSTASTEQECQQEGGVWSPLPEAGQGVFICDVSARAESSGGSSSGVRYDFDLDEEACENAGGTYREFTEASRGVFVCEFRGDAGGGSGPTTGSTNDGGDLVEVGFATQQGENEAPSEENKGKQCGAPLEQAVITGFDFGCKGFDIGNSGGQINPIVDMAFAIFRVLASGVGLMVILSVIVAGIQYSLARGNPQQIEASMKRVTNAFIALITYIFMWAILNFLVPGGMFL